MEVFPISRSDRFIRSMEIADHFTQKQWLDLAKDIKKFKGTLSTNASISPTALMIEIDDSNKKKLDDLEDKLKNSLSLVVLQTRFEYELLLFNYYHFLQAEEEKSVIIQEPTILRSTETRDYHEGMLLIKRVAELYLSKSEINKIKIQKILNILEENDNE